MLVCDTILHYPLYNESLLCTVKFPVNYLTEPCTVTEMAWVTGSLGHWVTGSKKKVSQELYNTLHYITLHYTTLHYTPLHHTLIYDQYFTD